MCSIPSMLSFSRLISGVIGVVDAWSWAAVWDWGGIGVVDAWSWAAVWDWGGIGVVDAWNWAAV